MYYSILKTRFCPLILIGDENGLKRLHMETDEGNRTFEIDPTWIKNDAVFETARKQLTEYVDGYRFQFDLKLNSDGTDYQKGIWDILYTIPFGAVWTYKQVAVSSGNPKASRAVGAANGQNPIPIIVPCHRVIGTNGKLTGFAFGTKLKQKLIDFEMMMKVYNRLIDAYGHQNWWPAGSVYEMMVGAILTQNTAWTNVELTLKNFGNNLTPEFVEQVEILELQDLVRPSGFFTQKAERLKRLTSWFKQYDYDILKVSAEDMLKLRKELLDINGIGGETADAIVLYATHKPSFVIDAYTRRIFGRLGMDVPRDYDNFRQRFMDALPNRAVLFNEYHALLVQHAKNYCNTQPKCNGCPLSAQCDYYVVTYK